MRFILNKYEKPLPTSLHVFTIHIHRNLEYSFLKKIYFNSIIGQVLDLSE